MVLPSFLSGRESPDFTSVHQNPETLQQTQKKSCAASFCCRFYVSVLATSKVPYFDIFLAREESRRFLCWLHFLIFLFWGSPGMTTSAGSMLKKSLIDFQFHVSFRKSIYICIIKASANDMDGAGDSDD